MRLAIFLDQLFCRHGNLLSTNESYALFFDKLANVDTEIVFVGRESLETGRLAFIFDSPHISLCAIPYYSSLYQLWRANPSIYRNVRRLVRNCSKDWDAVLIHGPHPLGHIIARECGAMGVPVIPVLRQNLKAMMRAHSGIKRLVTTVAALTLEADFKRIARGRSVLAVGMEMADAYRHVSGQVHTFMPCLIDNAQFRIFSEVAANTDAKRLICVGRLSPEKGQKYLLDAVALLKGRGLVCHLDIVGSGPLDEDLRRQTIALGLEAQVVFHGFVGYGPELFELYRDAGVAVLPSITEGLPQVINEALSIGLPTIATRVGGIPSFLTDGDTALLVPPGDVNMLASAIERLVRDNKLCEHLRREGRLLMVRNTLEANQDAVMKVIRNEVVATRTKEALGA